MKYLVEVENGREGDGAGPSVGPAYRNVLAKDGFPSPAPGLETCWDVFRMSVERNPNNRMLSRRETVDGKGNSEQFGLPVNKKSDICTIMYTSGTTGDPKGVMVSNDSIVTFIAGANCLLGNAKAEGHKHEEAAPIFDKIVFIENLENIYGLVPAIDSIWIYGNSFESFLVAVVNPNQQALERWAEETGVTGDFTALCENPKAKEYILEEITKVGRDPYKAAPKNASRLPKLDSAMLVCALPLPAKIYPRNHSHPSRQRNPTVAASVTSCPPRIPTKHPFLEPLKHRLIRLADAGRVDDALSTLDLMSDRGVPADLVSYSVLLRSCIRSRNLVRGRLVHRRLLDSGLRLDSLVTNSLIALYSKCGEWEVACSIFEEMGSRRDVVSWTALISCAAQNGMEEKAILLFCEMIHTGIIPNEYSFCGVIQACSKSEHDWVGRVVLGFVIKMGFFRWDASVGCALIDMFGRRQDLSSARKVFDGMRERNTVVWTLLITRYGQHGRGRDAIGLFLDMLHDGFEPDRFTISSVISACSGLESLEFGRQMHSLAIRYGLSSDACVGCSLIDMYAKCTSGRSMEDSRKVFDRMSEHNVMSWTAVISGYVQSGGHDEAAMELFRKMMMEGGRVRPNHFTYSSILKACANLSDLQLGEQIHAQVTKSSLAYVNFVGNSLVTMYARAGRMEEARRAFSLLYEKNVVSYNAIVDGYAKNSDCEEALELLYQIEGTDVGASAFTFASLLSAAASVGMMSKGQQLHAQMLKAGFGSDVGVGNSLVSMYSRCGGIDDACRAFGEMGDRNVVSWTAMITGFAKHGDAARALGLFHDMVATGVGRPNAVTYVALLSACSHAGLIEEGWEHFRAMQRDHGVSPTMEHYACMVDLLGRSGRVEEAFGFVKSLPAEADALVWKTLLGACRVHGDIGLGEIVAKNILELAPEDPAPYVLLSNLYAEAGRWEDVAMIRRGMRERRLSKEAGLSWVEMENSIHKFHVGDTSHPQARQIYAKLDELFADIKEMGYVPNTNLVLHDVEEEMKEQYLLQHSEKIAVAFGLINTSAPKPIRVFKNLRVCGDCHDAIKYISKATGREVILRDSNRFHHICNGECSCGEYW
ncbi:hypothetical protein GW17_00011953 [Ensete ventricosum]|nr:hypothetical protein GW17_00011953 [Ensete ventricosum]